MTPRVGSWLPWYGVSLPVVMAGYVLTAPAGTAAAAWPLALALWTLVALAFRILCPVRGGRGVALAAVPFLLSLAVSSLVVAEMRRAFGTPWAGSDDIFYLGEADRVVQSLTASGWNLKDTWLELGERDRGAWTLNGWPFLLGTTVAWISANPDPALVHAVALLLNAACLALVLALLLHVLEAPAAAPPGRVLAVYLMLAFEPLVYAGQCLKESLLQASLMLSFVAVFRLAEAVRPRWIVLGALGLLGVLTNRVAYVPLLMLVFYWHFMDRLRFWLVLKLALGLGIAALAMGAILSFAIRELTVADFLTGFRLEAEPGLGMTIYSLPYVGPFLYYALAPLPVPPWEWMDTVRTGTVMLRSLGSVAWTLLAGYVMFHIGVDRRLLRHPVFAAALIMAASLLAATVVRADDPRYKQPSNFYLAILLALAWSHARLRRAAPCGGRAQPGGEPPS